MTSLDAGVYVLLSRKISMHHTHAVRLLQKSLINCLKGSIHFFQYTMNVSNKIGLMNM
jgi:hypothetical protein